MEGLVKCSLIFKVRVFKRGACFKTRKKSDVPFLISNTKNVISCQFPKILETRIWGHKVTKALQKTKEDFFSQLNDYNESFCEQQYIHGSCLFVCSNSNLLISLIPPNSLRF